MRTSPLALLPLSLLLACPQEGVVVEEKDSGAPVVDDTDSGRDSGDVAGAFALSPESLELPLVFVGQSTSATVTVADVGTTPVDVVLAVTADASADWTISPASAAPSPGFASDHQLTFTPSTYGVVSATVTATDSVTGLSATTAVSAEAQLDADGDGYGSVLSGGSDCNDLDPSIYLGAPETYYDGIDQDCDGADGSDQDGDGFPIATDCNDADDTVYPGAPEVPYDGVDQDCDGADLSDADGDGYDVSTDCDDTNPAANPGADEVWYDGVDGDCDGADDYDQDADGFDNTDDCDDTDDTIYPGAPEVSADGIDQDCDGGDTTDADGDGYDVPDDCDDTDDTVYPGAYDVYYDGVDQDCDGSDADDKDGDGYGYLLDCDDNDASIYPGAFEEDDGEDTDCDGVVESGPTAVASYDPSSVLELCSLLVLDGTDSTDPDGDALDYSWELTGAPAGSALTTADIDAPNDATPYFYADVAGDYTFTLTVDDGGTSSMPDSVTITIAERATNSAPVAAAGDDQSTTGTAYCAPVSYGASYDCNVCAPVTFTLDASATADADSDDLDYEWLVTRGRSYGTLSATDTVSTELVFADAPSTYLGTTTSEVTVRLTVTDCMGASDTDEVLLSYACTGE